MTVKVVLITHENVGASLLKTAEKTLGTLPLTTTVVKVSQNCNTDKIKLKLDKLVQDTASQQGVLVLTDMYGATPSNLALNLNDLAPNIRIVSGLNLPMLVRVMNYPSLDLDALAEKAVSGGRDGVLDCNLEQEDNNE